MELLSEILFRRYMIASRIIAVLLFCWQFKRRNYFFLRLISFVVLCAVLDYAATKLPVVGWIYSLFNIVTFITMSLVVWFCFKEKFFTVFFCCIAGKCVMHFSEYVSLILSVLTGLDTVYFRYFVFIPICIVVYFVFASRIRKEECGNINNWKIMIYAFIIVFTSDFLITTFRDLEPSNQQLIILCVIYLITCFTVFSMLFGLLTESEIKREAEIINQLRIKEREQYAISLDTINLIGIKYHDIKNMLESHKDKFTEEEIEEMKKTVDGRDFVFKTGNRTLDTVLTEKFIACKKMQIRLECIANGAALNFMREMDIYSLFLNALNNAIESADKMTDQSKRVVWLKIYVRGKLLFIQTRNYYAEEPKITHGNLILTTKTDKRYHGYGMQSMKMIVENYGGTMSFDMKQGIFSLGLVIPLP